MLAAEALAAVAEWQTRTVEGRVGNRAGSSPVSRTMFPKTASCIGGCFLLSAVVSGQAAAVC